MENTNMTFEGRIEEYLTSLADRDRLFAKKYGNPKKSIKECCQYIITTVRKSKRNAFDDDEIFGMAVHYYEEENPGEIDNSVRCTVKVSVDNLSEKEKENARKEAMADFKKSCIEKFKENIDKTRRKRENKEEQPLPSLF